MKKDETQRWLLIAFTAWCALALTFCHGASGGLPPAPAKVLPGAVVSPAVAPGLSHATVAEAARHEASIWLPILGDVIRITLPLALLAAAVLALPKLLRPLWDLLQPVFEAMQPLWDVVEALLGKGRPAPLAEGGLTFTGALAAGYAAIKPDFKADSFLVIIVGAFAALASLVVARIKSLTYRILALAGLAASLLGLPALAIAVWPYFVHPSPNGGAQVPITGLQKVAEELHNVTPDTLAVLVLAIVIFAIKVSLALARPSST